MKSMAVEDSMGVRHSLRYAHGTPDRNSQFLLPQNSVFMSLFSFLVFTLGYPPKKTNLSVSADMGKKSVTETVSMFEAVDRECRPRLTDSQKRWLSAFGEHFRETSDEGLSYLYDAGLFSKTDWLSNYAAWNQMKTFQTHLGFSDIEKLIKASRKKKRLAISDIRPSLLSLPYRIVGLSGSLVELCITEVDLREFPLSVCSLENLTSLTVSKCPLTRIPAEVRRLSRPPKVRDIVDPHRRSRLASPNARP